MTTDEIFSKVASHMLDGIMIHNEMAKAYDFLGLWGFAKCHTYHTVEEQHSYSSFQHYYASHYFKLLKIDNPQTPTLIPESWYKYNTSAVDVGTKKNTVKDLMTKWVEWERDTKKLYQEMRRELITIDEIAAALELDKYILDVTDELKHAEKKLIKLETLGYDIGKVIDWQQPLYKKYKKLLGW